MPSLEMVWVTSHLCRILLAKRILCITLCSFASGRRSGVELQKNKPRDEFAQRVKAIELFLLDRDDGSWKEFCLPLVEIVSLSAHFTAARRCNKINRLLFSRKFPTHSGSRSCWVTVKAAVNRASPRIKSRPACLSVRGRGAWLFCLHPDDICDVI